MGMAPWYPRQVSRLVMIHAGTMLPVIVYYWPRWRRLLTGKRCQVPFPPDRTTVMAPETGAEKVPDTFFREPPDNDNCPAYRQEPGVNPQSTTETFAALRLFIDNCRWNGVPSYLRSGTALWT